MDTEDFASGYSLRPPKDPPNPVKTLLLYICEHVRYRVSRKSFYRVRSSSWTFGPKSGGNFASPLGGIWGPKAARRRRSPAISEPPATAAPRSIQTTLALAALTGKSTSCSLVGLSLGDRRSFGSLSCTYAISFTGPHSELPVSLLSVVHRDRHRDTRPARAPVHAPAHLPSLVASPITHTPAAI